MYSIDIVLEQNLSSSFFESILSVLDFVIGCLHCRWLLVVGS